MTIVMNILFLTENEISPMQGGTERITHTLSREFLALGHECSLLYLIPASPDISVSGFTAKYRLNTDYDIAQQISAFLESNFIGVVIVNLVRYSSKKLILPDLYNVTRKQGAKVIVCYHAMPGEDIVSTSLSNIVYRLVNGYDQKQAIKDLANKVFRGRASELLFGRRIKAKYRLNIDNCDRFVMLSQHFYEPYCRLAGVTDKSKFCAIPNALSFIDTLQAEKLQDKQKKVLIVARMHERSKRLSMALTIWKKVEADDVLHDWELDIVGGGPDIHYYRQLIKYMGLKRCLLLGRQPEIDQFYADSSIFMMTSAFEGFGITLIEAQQNGVVPIVTDSFASLRDIITSGKNGVIVRNNDVDSFYEALKKLMLDEDGRMQMARSGLQSCQAFSQKEITSMWIGLIEETLRN